MARGGSRTSSGALTQASMLWAAATVELAIALGTRANVSSR
jgi:hypothetical protein